MNMFSAEGGGKTAAELAAEQRAAKQRAAAQKKAAQQKAAAQKAMQKKATGAQKAGSSGKNTAVFQAPLNTRAMEYGAADMGLPLLPSFMPQPTQQVAGVQKKAAGAQKASPAGKNTVPLQLPLNTRAMEYAAADMGLPLLPSFMPQPTQQVVGVQKKAIGVQKAGAAGKNTATFQLPLNTRAMEYAATDMGLPMLPSFMPQPTQQAAGVQKKAAGAQKASSGKNTATFQLPLNTRAMEYAAADMGLPLLPGFVQQDTGWNSERSPFAYLGEKAAAGAGTALEGMRNHIIDWGRAMTAADLAQQTRQAQALAPLGGVYERLAQDAAKAEREIGAALPGAADRLRSNRMADYAGGINEKYDNPTGLLKTMGDVSSGVGGMAPKIAASLMSGGFLGMPMLFSAAAGNAAQEARQGGADEDTALLYGLLSGGVEWATEHLTDGIPGLQTGKAKEALKKAAWSTSGQRILKKIVDIFGEGAEEYISEVAGAYLKKLWNGDKRGGWQTFVETQPEALYSGLIGALTSGVMNLPGDTINAVRNNRAGRDVAASGNVDAVISAGLNLPLGSEGHALATQLAQTRIDGGRVENARLGELARSTGRPDAFMMPLPKVQQSGQTPVEPVQGQRYSIQKDQQGRLYVQGDRQVLTGEDPVQWERQLYDYINENIRRGRDLTLEGADGDPLTITEKTAWKMGYRNDVRQKKGQSRKMSDADYAAKLRAAGHIDEIAQVSERGPRTVPDYKNHNFAQDGFNYRKAYYQDADGQMYELTVSVGKNGEVNTVYNIGRMKKEASQLLGAQMAQVPEGTAAKTSSLNSILQSGKNATRGLAEQNRQIRAQALAEGKAQPAELDALERMAKQKGLTVQYVYQPDSAVSGSISGDTMTVNLANESYAFGTAVHETGHAMKATDAKSFAKFQNAVLRFAQSDERLSAYAQQVRESYTAPDSPALKSLLGRDGKINTAALDEEVSLKLAEQLVRDPEKLTRAVGQDRGLAGQFLDFVRGLKNSIAIKLTGSQKAMLDEAERTLTNMLRGKAGNVAGKKYSYIGENANLNQLERATLEAAKGMEADGETAGDIRWETGWFRGADGKWRLEVDDSSAVYTVAAQSGGGTLGDHLQHPELKRHYPELFLMPFKVRDGLPQDMRGRYLGQEKGFQVALDAQRPTVLHEVQHGIQNLEGFARGANRVVAGKAALTETFQTVKNSPEYNALQTADERMNFVIEQTEGRSPNGTLEGATRNRYRNTAGEKEARDTAKRANYSQAERKILPPDTTGIVTWRQQVRQDFVDMLRQMGYSQSEIERIGALFYGEGSNVSKD